MTAPPSNSQIMSILDKSNSSMKDDEVYQCVRTALEHLNDFAAEDDNSIETSTNSIGLLIYFASNGFWFISERRMGLVRFLGSSYGY